jgi:hypothetical protein
VFADVKRTPATAFNVTTTVAGRDRSLPPLVIMTPRSGWYRCASERGGGIAWGNTIQSSDDGMQRMLEQALAPHNLPVGVRMPHDRVPGGEAEVVHRGGGRYVSVIGSNLLFHNPGDRGSAVSDARVIARFVDTFGGIATDLAGTQPPA